MALNNANEKAWNTLQIALAGESFLSLTAKEDRNFARQMRDFLDYAATLQEFEETADFRQRCLNELREAKKKGLLTGGNHDASQLAQITGEFAKYADPIALLNAEWEFVGQLANTLEKEKFKNLATLLRKAPARIAPDCYWGCGTTFAGR